MLNDNVLKNMIKNARGGFKKRNFTQSAELSLILKDIDVKKGFSINEVVSLPNKTTKACAMKSQIWQHLSECKGSPTELLPIRWRLFGMGEFCYTNEFVAAP